ncbi:Spo0E family sporulation regulatory protein-aspartic acid phosphatase [Tepidibacillus fermentans]|uniref:Spo0E like sporulation regulatory protein n=1 Tax=Tepidibacillus fermentans TaxID=1281767 RepID=A0A4R3KHG6_9BACI|nr:Spo0E family sporulation regulatory protein-aspartic acid phosphatase [Tepidibacillus fermentans]TCS82479.1 Spo0E like sporulation regulatory protein [Tepidibacillus fermentans]
MDKEDKIEIARNILNNAANMNMNKEIILKISQKIDKYIIEYLRNDGEKG